MKKIRYFILPVLFLLLGGCQQNYDRLIERASLTGKAAAEAQTQAELKAQAERAQEMEKDLAQRFRFYEAVRGRYEGPLMRGDQQFFIRVILTPALPAYPVNRVRTIEEIQNDLLLLGFHAEITQWVKIPGGDTRLGSDVASGCQINNIKPDLVRGEVSVISENCQIAVTLKLGDEISPNILSSDLAQSIREGRLDEIRLLKAQMRFKQRSVVEDFVVKKAVVQ